MRKISLAGDLYLQLQSEIDINTRRYSSTIEAAAASLFKFEKLDDGIKFTINAPSRSPINVVIQS